MLILGSRSPRRKEILEFFQLPFRVEVSQFDEHSVPYKGDPEDFASTIAMGKARDLQTSFPNESILTADSVVFCNDRVYGKPKDRQEAVSFLTELSGQWHTVYTGVAVVKGEDRFVQVEGTRVLFNTLSQQQINHFLNAISWNDKAGSYTIQTVGGLIVNKIEGCYYNVTGLPINTTQNLLTRIGMDLWEHLS